MALTEFKPPQKKRTIDKGVISMTNDGWYFGVDEPAFKFAKILFDKNSGVVKFVPVEEREHAGVGYIKTHQRNKTITYTLRCIRFARSGDALFGRYRQIEGEEYTYKFFQPATRTISKSGYPKKRSRKFDQ